MGYVPPGFSEEEYGEIERRRLARDLYGTDPPHFLPPSRYIPAPPRARSYRGEGQAVARIIMAVGVAMIALALNLLR